MASVTSAMGLMQQRQIDYTRSNESEADRLGIRTLARSGYDVDAMAGMFERMATATRANEAGQAIPDFLRTHPVTVTRIGEARLRADQQRRETESQDRNGIASWRPAMPVSPLHPGVPGLHVDLDRITLDSPGADFAWVKERLRVLSAPTLVQALNEYELLAKRQPDGLSAPQRYGLALARLRAGNPPASAIELLQPLHESDPDNLWIGLTLAEAWSRAGMTDRADALLASASRKRPDNRAITLVRAELLNAQGTADAARKALEILRSVSPADSHDPALHRQLARAWELAGDPVRAGEAHAEMTWLNGRAEQALLQLQTLRRRDDLDYASQARIEARIETLMPEVLELKRQGVHDPVLQKK